MEDYDDIYGDEEGYEDQVITGIENNNLSQYDTSNDSSRPKQTQPIPVLPSNPLTGTAPGIASRQLVAATFHELNWWTSDADMKTACALAGVNIELKDVVFAEHKVNGKSKGIAYIDFGDQDAAETVKKFFDSRTFQDKQVLVELSVSHGKNPFQTLPKEPGQRTDGRPMRPLPNNNMPRNMMMNPNPAMVPPPMRFNPNPRGGMMRGGVNRLNAFGMPRGGGHMNPMMMNPMMMPPMGGPPMMGNMMANNGFIGGGNKRPRMDQGQPNL